MKNKMSRAESYAIFQKADKLWSDGQLKKAFLLFLKAAHSGDPSSQHNVAYFYDVGEGILRDVKKAFYWYKRAWRNNKQTGTCSNIALLYAEIGKNRQAILWWNKAINRGDGDAALELAKYLMRLKRRGWHKKVVSLLNQAIILEHITVTREEAVILLTRLTQQV